MKVTSTNLRTQCLYQVHTVSRLRVSTSYRTMAAFFFASPVDVDIKLESEDIRKQVDVKLEKERTVSCPVYYDGESVGGTVC